MTKAFVSGGHGDRLPSATASEGALRGLDALDVFLADMRDGLGPYLAIYPLAVRSPDGQHSRRDDRRGRGLLAQTRTASPAGASGRVTP